MYLIFQRSAKSIIDVCVSLSYSYQEIGAVLFLHANISQISVLQEQEVICCECLTHADSSMAVIIQSTERGTITDEPPPTPPPERSENVSPVPPQALISSDGNQATNSNVIIIHVVNHLLLQKNSFPHCPTLLLLQT